MNQSHSFAYTISARYRCDSHLPFLEYSQVERLQCRYEFPGQLTTLERVILLPSHFD